MDLKTFLAGDSFDAYTYFGAHVEQDGVVFRVYAPNASKVTLEGDFSSWKELPASYSMHGIWIFHVHGARHGQNYKYCVYSRRGKRTEKADPYGFGMGGYGCSVIRDIGPYEFNDTAWMRSRSLNFDKPVYIFELHASSWFRSFGRYISYEKAADGLIAYLKENHYTHVEFLPLGEHPLDASWGYQTTGFFSPTARFGEAWQLMYLIERLHLAGIGAIIDFVCVHFAVDGYGLKLFDGSALYESSETARRRSDWGSFYFEHTRPEVKSFLKSAAAYWIDTYHFDGIRFDAVSHLVYGQGRADCGENPGGIRFLKEINSGLNRRFPDVMRIAEDSTAYPAVTAPVEQGGLGFHYKWAMGWSYDVLSFFRTPPAQRAGSAGQLTFALNYFGSERYLLAISHDVCGGTGRSLLSQLPLPDRLRSLKLLYLYTAVHPGKKLFFHGTELGALTPWNGRGNVDRSFLTDAKFAGFQAFCKDLNMIAIDSPALYEADHISWGSRWVSSSDGGNGVFVLIRHSAGQHILMIMNTSPEEREHWFELPGVREASTLIHSQWRRYGGKTAQKVESVQCSNGWIGVKLPRLSGLIAEVEF